MGLYRGSPGLAAQEPFAPLRTLPGFQDTTLGTGLHEVPPSAGAASSRSRGEQGTAFYRVADERVSAVIALARALAEQPGPSRSLPDHRRSSCRCRGVSPPEPSRPGVIAALGLGALATVAVPPCPSPPLPPASAIGTLLAWGRRRGGAVLAGALMGRRRRAKATRPDAPNSGGMGGTTLTAGAR